MLELLEIKNTEIINNILGVTHINSIKIIDKIIDNHYEKQRKMKKEPLLCFSCKLNNKNNKCSNNCCGKCCSGCKIHK